MFIKMPLLFKGTRFAQYFSIIIAALGVTSCATYLIWPSPTITKLKAEDSPLGKPITSDESSWIVAIFLLTGLPVGITYHLIMGRLGRKLTFQIASVFLFIPWLLIIFGDNVIYVLAGRAVGGVVLGMTIITTSMYAAEISDPDIRGRLGTSYGIMKLFGSIFVLGVGPFVSYATLAVVCGVVPLVHFVLLFFIPESPYYLVRRNRIDEARAALEFLSGTTEEKLINEKLDAISLFVTEDEEPLTMRQVLSNKLYLKVIGIVVTVSMFEYLSGSNAVMAYQQQIIESSKSSINGEMSSIIFAVIQIPAAIISGYLVDKLGRKVILYIGSTGCAISLIAEGIYFYLQDKLHADVSSLSWLPTTGIVVYLVTYAIYASIPYILISEFFPHRLKNIATTFFLVSGIICVFFVTKTFEPIKDAWGVYTAFWLYAFFSIATIVFTYFCLPETKNKSFEQIEQDIYK